jgi:hypothetical protein
MYVPKFCTLDRQDMSDHSLSARGRNEKCRASNMQDFSADPCRDDVPMAEAIPVDEYYCSKMGIMSRDQGITGKKKSGNDDSGGKQKVNKAKQANAKRGKGEKLPPILLEAGRQSSLRWPKALCDEVIQSFGTAVDEAAGTKFMNKHNWTKGMQSAFFTSTKKIPIRFFIVDDSGSMNNNDGHRIIRTGSGKMAPAKMIQCTRWAELSDSLKFHAKLSETCKTPSEFRLLNGADLVMVGLGNHPEGLQFSNEVLDEQPAGQTPLCRHVNDVVSAIKQMEPQLRAQGKKAAVIIATDGESTDGNITSALRPLRELPAWVVLRLCTNEQTVVDYWNNVDNELELEMDVIDDLVKDAEQVFKVNRWLNYGDELHRLREFGTSFKEMDLIDECAFGSEQMATMLNSLFGCKLPHPDIDYGVFRAEVVRYNNLTDQIFNPLTGRYDKIVNLKEMDKAYGGGVAAGSAACVIL